jgi:membrane associated rhomboid family serine protease
MAQATARVGGGPPVNRPQPTLGQRPGATPAVTTLLVLNGLAYYAQISAAAVMLRSFALWPLNLKYPNPSNFEVWQLLSYGFLHGSSSHLIFNMLALWMFGKAMEQAWGTQRFVIYYLLCIVGAGVLHLLVTELGSGSGIVVGASGGVFGLLLAYGLAFPNRQVMLLFPPIPMRAITLVIGYGILTLLMGLTGTASFIAHFAHLGGMVAGFVLIRGWPQYYPTSWRPRGR